MSKNEVESYSMEGHRFYQNTNAGKHVCSNCGLVRLHNKATEWCVDRGCNYKLHPSYKKAIHNLTKMNWS